MKKLGQFLLVAVLATSFVGCKKKIYGCMDEGAKNYSPIATKDAQNCVYEQPETEEVIVSTVFKNVNFQQNQYSDGYEASLTWNEITQNIIDKGAVNTYVSYGVDWTILPYTYASGYQQVSTTISYAYSQGKIDLFVQDSDGIIGSNPGPLDVKIVILK